MEKYKIFVVLSNKTYVYSVDNYEILNDCGLTQIRFYDKKKQAYQTFDSRVCQIEETSKNDKY